MYIKKSVLPCFCYKDFYLKGEKTWWLKLCKIFLRQEASCPSQGIFTPGGVGGGGGNLPRPRYLTLHPFLFREKWLMVHFMIIHLTVLNRKVYLSNKLSFGMESARFSGIVASFYGHCILDLNLLLSGKRCKKKKTFLNKVLSGFLGMGMGGKLSRPWYLTPRLTSSHRKIVNGQY